MWSIHVFCYALRHCSIQTNYSSVYVCMYFMYIGRYGMACMRTRTSRNLRIFISSQFDDITYGKRSTRWLLLKNQVSFKLVFTCVLDIHFTHIRRSTEVSVLSFLYTCTSFHEFSTRTKSFSLFSCFFFCTRQVPQECSLLVHKYDVKYWTFLRTMFCSPCSLTLQLFFSCFIYELVLKLLLTCEGLASISIVKFSRHFVGATFWSLCIIFFFLMLVLFLMTLSLAIMFEVFCWEKFSRRNSSLLFVILQYVSNIRILV